MRASEFIVEAHKGKISKRLQSGTRGLNVFYDATHTNSDYTLNRIMMACAMADGTDAPIELDSESWVGRSKSAHPYTKEEQAMLKQAYRAVGAGHQDLNHGDMDSEEHPLVNTKSPVVSFKGYPR